MTASKSFWIFFTGFVCGVVVGMTVHGYFNKDDTSTDGNTESNTDTPQEDITKNDILYGDDVKPTSGRYPWGVSNTKNADGWQEETDKQEIMETKIVPYSAIVGNFALWDTDDSAPYIEEMTFYVYDGMGLLVSDFTNTVIDAVPTIGVTMLDIYQAFGKDPNDPELVYIMRTQGNSTTDNEYWCISLMNDTDGSMFEGNRKYMATRLEEVYEE